MKLKDTIKLAIQCLKKNINRWQSMPVSAPSPGRSADYPAALAAVERRKAIKEAMHSTVVEILNTWFQPSLFK